MISQDTDHESVIATALEDANSTSTRRAVDLNGINESTLRSRKKGSRDMRTAKQKTQRLTSKQEEDLF
jgi:hypothetical protein